MSTFTEYCASTKEESAPPLVIVLTGPSGAGKTTVATMFETCLGALVLSADTVGHDILRDNHKHSAKSHILDAFGTDILDYKAKEIDRDALRAKVSANPNLMRRLNEIMLPRIAEAVKDEARADAAQFGMRLFVLDGDCANLAYFEPAEVWVLDCPRDVRLARISARRAVDEEDAQCLVADFATSEHDDNAHARELEIQRLGFVPRIIDTNVAQEELREYVLDVFRQLGTPFFNKTRSGGLTAMPVPEDMMKRPTPIASESMAQLQHLAQSFVALARIFPDISDDGCETTMSFLQSNKTSTLSAVPLHTVFGNVVQFLPCVPSYLRLAATSRAFLSFMLSEEVWRPIAVLHGAAPSTRVVSWLGTCASTIQCLQASCAFWAQVDMCQRSPDPSYSKFAMANEHIRLMHSSDNLKEMQKLAAVVPAHSDSAPSQYLFATDDADIIPIFESDPNEKIKQFGIDVITLNFSRDIAGLLKLNISRRTPSLCPRLDFRNVGWDVLKNDGACVAACFYRVLPGFRGGTRGGLFEVLFLASDKASRLQKNGTKLVVHMEKLARKHHCAAMYVETGPVHTTFFWEGFGFRVVGPRKSQWCPELVDLFDRSFFECRCLRFRDTVQHFKPITP
eukprot:PhM_4_TR11369/c0_g1_i1/m.58897